MVEMFLKQNSKRLFFRKTSDTVYFLGLCLLAILLMLLEQQQYPAFERLRTMLAVLAYPLQVAVDLPVAGGRWSVAHMADHLDLVNENKRLQTEHQYLKTSLLKLQSLELENQRLRALLSAAQSLNGRVAVAEIIGIDLDPYQHQLLLNKGAQGQVYEGQPLLDAEGIMGQVVQVNAISSYAMLITDPDHATPVEVKRNGLRTIALGRGNIEALDLPYLPQNADIKTGDILLTSGLDGRFPAGYPVGVITQIDYPTGYEFAEVTAKPSAQLQQHRQVLLMWPAPAPASSPTASSSVPSLAPLPINVPRTP